MSVNPKVKIPGAMTRVIPRIGVGGPVGSGKTALIETIVPRLVSLGLKPLVVTNDIFTREDAEHAKRTLAGVLPPERIRGVQTGACPHTAVREDPSMNLLAIEELTQLFPDADLTLIESGGDNLTLTFSPALADYQIYVIDVAAGDKIPRKRGQGITQTDLLGNQQNRPGPSRWGRPGSNAPGRRIGAGRQALPVHQLPHRRWGRFRYIGLAHRLPPWLTPILTPILTSRPGGSIG